MPAPLSNDLRKRIIATYEKGKSVKEIVQIYSVGQNTVYSLIRLMKETGSYSPRPANNGRKPKLHPDQLNQIEKQILEKPDITLQELLEQLKLPVCIATLCHTINQKLGLRRKKNFTSK